MRLRPAFALFLALAAAGCGGGAEGERVSERLRRSLPTQQYALSEEVCPEHLGMPPKQERRTRRRGKRQLAALLDAYRANPDARVRTSYSSSDEDPGIHHEDLSVEDLLETRLSTAEEIADGEDDYDCFERVAEALRDARGQ